MKKECGSREKPTRTEFLEEVTKCIMHNMGAKRISKAETTLELLVCANVSSAAHLSGSNLSGSGHTSGS